MNAAYQIKFKISVVACWDDKPSQNKIQLCSISNNSKFIIEYKHEWTNKWKVNSFIRIHNCGAHVSDLFAHNIQMKSKY